MWVRVGGAHRRALVLEELHVVDLRAAAQIENLLGPQIHHLANGGRLHFRQGEVVAWAEADDTADARLRLGLQQLTLAHITARSIGEQGSKVVFKDKGAGVLWVLVPAGAFVAGAEIAARVVLGAVVGRNLFHLAEPGALGAVRRNQHPVAIERVAPPVRVFGGDKGR